MNSLKTLLLASGFVAGGVLAAAAQSVGSGANGSGDSGDVAAAVAADVYATTHCKGGNAQVHLKSTVSSAGGSALSSITGSGATEVFRAETQAPGRLPVRVRWL